jgi:alpha-1,2-mannosyltransferase
MTNNGITAALDRLANNPMALWLVTVLVGIAIPLIVWQFSEPSDLFSDFYKANYPAAETLWENGLGATWPLTEKGGFSNLPVVGWLYVPFIWVGEEWAGWVWCVIGMVALFGAYQLLQRSTRLGAPHAALLAFLFLINGPIVNSLREGQSSHVVLLFLVVGLVLWRSNHSYAAGLAFGFSALIKLPLLLLGVYFVLRQRWSIVVGGATVIGVTAVLSLLLFGIDGNIGWFQEWVAPYLNGYIPAYNVQSVDGFLVRLSHGEEFLIHWDPPLVPTTFHRIARFLMFAALYGGSLVLIWRAHRRAPVVMAEGGPSPRDLLELSLMINLALLTSPISWTHYYLWLLLPWALYLGGDLPLRDDATTRFLMRASVTLVSLPVIVWSPMEPSWYAAILSRTLVSVWLIGGCLLFVALARGLWQFEAAPAADKVSTALRAAP